MSVATVHDVETSLMRPLTETESEYAQSLLARAENLLRVRIPDLSDRAEKDEQFRALVAQVEGESLARVFRAGEAGAGIYSSESEDGYSYSLNFKVASGLLDILPEEWARLLGSGGFRSVAPATDGYAQVRYAHLRPDLWFQYRWPAQDQLSERLL